MIRDTRPGGGIDGRERTIEPLFALVRETGESGDLGKGEEETAFVAHHGIGESGTDAVGLFKTPRFAQLGKKMCRDGLAERELSEDAVKSARIVERIVGVVLEQDERGHARV